MPDYKNIIVFLLIFALFLGATIEISDGYAPIGILLFVIAILLISRIRFGKYPVIKQSKLHMFLGVLIVAFVIVLYVLTHTKHSTLVIMTFLLGISLIAYDIKNEEIRRMGKFGAYMSATFIALLLLFFNYLTIGFAEAFNHYLVMLPSVFIINAIGIPIQVISTVTVCISGVEDINVGIGAPCSGLYSMFLLIGIMIAYTRIEQVERRKFCVLLIISVLVAYIANLIRVTTIYIVGFYYGREMMYFVHLHLGWIIFVIVVAVLLYVLDRWTK